MKINIIGLPASGKTTLAAQLSSATSFPCLNLDTLVFRTVKKHQRVRVSSDVYIQTIEKFIKQKHWIVEGIYPIDKVLEQADLIIVMRRSFLTLLYLQWLRYCTDSQQRKEYGFISNVKLSWFIYHLYFNKMGITVYDNKKPLKVKDINKKIKKFRKKILFVKSNRDIELALQKITE